MRFPFRKIALAAVAMFFLAIILITSYIFAPIVLGQSDLTSTVLIVLGTASMILIILVGFVIASLSLLGIVEVLTSKKDTSYKIIWTLALFFLGIIGLVFYLFIGRKELQ